MRRHEPLRTEVLFGFHESVAEHSGPDPVCHDPGSQAVVYAIFAMAVGGKFAHDRSLGKTVFQLVHFLLGRFELRMELTGFGVLDFFKKPVNLAHRIDFGRQPFCRVGAGRETKLFKEQSLSVFLFERYPEPPA